MPLGSFAGVTYDELELPLRPTTSSVLHRRSVRTVNEGENSAPAGLQIVSSTALSARGIVDAIFQSVTISAEPGAGRRYDGVAVKIRDCHAG